MTLFSGMTDDQIALLGCFAALVVCGGLMSLSYYIRPRRTLERETETTLRFPVRETPAAESTKRESRRRAA